MAHVKLTQVGKAFGEVKILKGIDLDIHDGEFMVFVGPSGCGKSTLLRVIAGLEDITEGELRIADRVVNDVPPAERGISMVFQSYALYPHMNLFDNMAFGLKLAKVPKPEIESAVNSAAKILHIDHLLQRKPKDLSGGQRQRVAIGRAIVRKPEVFLFDEPLSNLDTALRVKMRYEFAKLHEQFKTTMVYVTHDQVEAMTLADRIVVLNAGRIEQVGAPMALYEHPCNVFVAGFIGSPGMNFIEAVVQQASSAGATVKLSGGEFIRCAVDAANAKPGDKVTLGVRPEHLRAGVADNALATTVTFVESLGSMTYAYCSNPGLEDVITCAVEGDRPVASGSSLALHVPPEKAYLFNAEGLAFRRLVAQPQAMRLEVLRTGALPVNRVATDAGAALALGFCLALGSAPAAAQALPSLLVWINGDKGYNGLQKVGDAFTRDSGVKVVVQHPEGAPDKFQAAAAAGKGPDIMCWPHDRVGEWAKSGLIVPVRPGARLRAEIDESAWRAFSYRGQTWGYPIAIEAVGLIYNKALVPTPPQSFEQVIELDKQLKPQGKSAILWAYNQSFFSWSLIAGPGGYVFGTDSKGELDPRSVGINNEGALKGVRMIERLVKDGHMPKGARYAEMEGAFARGQVAMMINGPWAWDNVRKVGIDFGVAPIPTVDGKPGKPFVGVLGCMITAPSKAKDVAREFIENHLLTVPALKTISADVPLGVPANKAYYAELSADPRIKATMDNARAGAPIPNIPEMGRFFPAMDAALEAITNGRQAAKDAMDGAAARMLTR